MPGQKTKDQWLYARSEDYQVDAIARVRILETSGCMPGQNTLDQWLNARSGELGPVDVCQVRKLSGGLQWLYANSY